MEGEPRLLQEASKHGQYYGKTKTRIGGWFGNSKDLMDAILFIMEAYQFKIHQTKKFNEKVKYLIKLPCLAVLEITHHMPLPKYK